MVRFLTKGPKCDKKKDFEDFLRVFISTQDAEMVSDVRALFDRIDKDRSGEVDKDELQEFLRASGLKDANVDAMMACVDSDKSGKIDFEEFRKLVHILLRIPAHLHLPEKRVMAFFQKFR